MVPMLLFAGLIGLVLSSKEGSVKVPEKIYIPHFEQSINDGSRTGKILGGQKSDISNLPWQVSLRYASDVGFSSTTNFCGGSIIHEQWVVTAAHCKKDKPVDGKFVVVAGLSDPTEWYSLEIDDEGEQKVVIKEGVQAFVEPDIEWIDHEENFADADGGDSNDIALIHIKKDSFEFNERIQKIELPGDDEPLSSFTDCEVSGYGKYSEDHLAKLSVDLVENEECGQIVVKENARSQGMLGLSRREKPDKVGHSNFITSDENPEETGQLKPSFENPDETGQLKPSFKNPDETGHSNQEKQGTGQLKPSFEKSDESGHSNQEEQETGHLKPGFEKPDESGHYKRSSEKQDENGLFKPSFDKTDENRQPSSKQKDESGHSRWEKRDGSMRLNLEDPDESRHSNQEDTDERDFSNPSLEKPGENGHSRHEETDERDYSNPSLDEPGENGHSRQEEQVDQSEVDRIIPYLDKLVCVWDEDDPSKSACPGDSGGPLSCTKRSGGTRYLLGAASYYLSDVGKSRSVPNPGCKERLQAPFFYASIMYHKDWICGKATSACGQNSENLNDNYENDYEDLGNYASDSNSLHAHGAMTSWIVGICLLAAQSL